MKCDREFLDSIDPKKSGSKYSANIRRYLARYKNCELPSVYAVKSELNEIVGTRSFIVGDYDKETGWLHGKRIMKIMGNHRTQGYAFTPNCFKVVEELPNFWGTYQNIGRCAIDTEHRIDMVGDEDRFVFYGDSKKCVWCNCFEFKKEIRTREYEVWVKVESK